MGHWGAFYTAGMILEGIVTTRDNTGAVHVAPMGPIVDASLTTLRLRPFKTSQTYKNLQRAPVGVFHVVDDVLLLARSAVGLLAKAPPTFPAEKISGEVLADCCRWYEFEIREFDDAQERAQLLAQVVQAGRVRDFFGFNRAKHAVLEAAILATRVHLIDLRKPGDSARTRSAQAGGFEDWRPRRGRGVRAAGALCQQRARTAPGRLIGAR